MYLPTHRSNPKRYIQSPAIFCEVIKESSWIFEIFQFLWNKKKIDRSSAAAYA